MKKYLIHIQLAPGDTARNRALLVKSARTVHKLSNQQCMEAYASKDGTCIGIVAAIDKPSHFIRKAIDGNNQIQDSARPKNPEYLTGLENGDKVLVIEMGEDISENGYSGVALFLQRH